MNDTILEILSEVANELHLRNKIALMDSDCITFDMRKQLKEEILFQMGLDTDE